MLLVKIVIAKNSVIARNEAISTDTMNVGLPVAIETDCFVVPPRNDAVLRNEGEDTKINISGTCPAPIE